MSTVLISPERHVVRDTPTSKLFRRLLSFDDIFTYFNCDSGQWILAYWISKTARLADEIEDLGSAMELVDPAFVNMITTCWKVVDWKKKKKLMLEREQRRIDKRNEEIIADCDRWKWLKERTANKAPVPYTFYPSMTGGS